MSDNIPSKQQSRNMSDNQAFLTNLPPEIIIDILSRLPIPTIVTCKCVSQKFLKLISSAAFADYNLSKPSPGIIIHQVERYVQNLCRIFEFVDEEELQHHDLHYKQLMEFDPRVVTTSPDANIGIVGSSVNGLVCLRDYSSQSDAFYICNPITREYITLPKTKETVQYPNMVMYGFGVSSASGQYKLIRISQGEVTSSGPSSRNILDLECLIYTVGTGSWRSIAPSLTFELNPYPGNAFLNGCLHWLVGDAEANSFIACFDLETEVFKSFPGHPFPSFFPIKGALVVLDECLWFCDCCSDDEIVLWVMKEYGVEESWTKEYVISKSIGYLGGLSYEAVVPLKVFKDGGILFLWQDSDLFYYSSKTETIPDVDLFGTNDWVEPLLYTPSFLSLMKFTNENIASF